MWSNMVPTWFQHGSWSATAHWWTCGIKTLPRRATVSHKSSKAPLVLPGNLAFAHSWNAQLWSQTCSHLGAIQTSHLTMFGTVECDATTPRYKKSLYSTKTFTDWWEMNLTLEALWAAIGSYVLLSQLITQWHVLKSWRPQLCTELKSLCAHTFLYMPESRLFYFRPVYALINVGSVWFWTCTMSMRKF